MIKKKIVWIDNLKGLAIIAVVAGHIASPLLSFIYTWHIPLFFLVSGLLINKERSIKDSIKRDFSRLIIPFVVFSIIGLTVEYIKRWIFPGFTFINGKINLWNEITGIFWWMDYSHLHQYGFVLWFLPALFWAKNIYLFLLKSLKNKYIVSIVCLVILLFVSNQTLVLPFCLNEAFIGLFWLSIGWLLTGRFWFLSLLILLFIPIPETNIAIRVISGYGVIYSLIVINTIMGVVKLIPKSIKLFEQFGSQTMPVLIIHPYINNIAFLLIIYLLKGNWLLEITVVLVVLSIIVKNLETIRMVLNYIVRNNKQWMVPFVTLRSLSVIIFQLLTHKEITKDLKMGRKILLFPGSVVSRTFLYTDIPDREEITLLRNKIDNKSIFLDIGANIGSYSVLLSDLTKKIYAFEPSPISNERCKRNFSLNGIKVNNVNKIALSDKRGVFGFTDFGGSSTVNHLTEDSEAKIKVQTDTLDNWVRNNINGTDFNLALKIDVEGNEEKIIKGANLLLKSKKIKYLILEVMNSESNVFKLIKSYGYKSGLITENNYYAEKI